MRHHFLLQELLLEALDVGSLQVFQKVVADTVFELVVGAFVFVNAGLFQGQAQLFEKFVSHLAEKRCFW